MLNIKQIVASILAASSTIAFASSIATPYEDRALEVGVAALYLRPSFAGNGLGYSSFSNYAGADNQGIIFTSNDSNKIHNITPKWDFGFELEGTYYFGFNNDLNLSWSHLNENVDGRLPDGSMFSGSIDGFFAGSLYLTTKWDTVKLELGRLVSLSDKKLLRLHAGLEYTKISNTFTNYPKLTATSETFFVSTDKITYSGVGPRFGADFEYLVNDRFSAYLSAAGSVLIGTAKQTISGYHDHNNALYGLIPFGVNNYVLSNNNVVVPELEAKLGVKYDYQLAQGNLGFDLGYIWMNYLNVLSTYTGMGIIGSSLGIPAESNFNLNGVSLGVTWVWGV